MTMPSGAYQSVSNAATVAVRISHEIDAGAFSVDPSKVTRITMSNSDGWPMADIAVHLVTDGNAPTGCSLELFVNAVEVLGTSESEPDPTENNLNGFVGARDMSGRSEHTFLFQSVPIPHGKYKVAFRSTSAKVKTGSYVTIKHLTGAPKS